MEQLVIYAQPGSFHNRLPILTLREHLCGFFENKTYCIEEGTAVDTSTGHTLCCGCDRLTAESGLRKCDNCSIEYINKDVYQNPRYETYCPRCVVEYEL